MIDIKIAVFLFSFYLLIFCNFIYEIIGCKLKQTLKTNIYIKHLLAFILLIFLIILTNENYASKHPIEILIISILVYIWFIITTRTNIYVIITILILLLIIYYIEVKIKYENNDKSKKIYKNIQYILLGITLLITIIGFIHYTMITYNEKKNNFDLKTFIFGKLTCDNDV